jgi:hypothetical protein
MIQDVATHEEAWGLQDSQGWVLAKIAQTRPGGPAYALPLWPRQELAALESRGPGEEPCPVDLETLLEDLLPQVGERGWAILAFGVADTGELFSPADFSSHLSSAWEALAEED